MNRMVRRLGAVSDFDIIIIGGKQYSAGELQAKSPTLIAYADTKVYTSAFDNSVVKYITKAGNPLGKYYSYLKPGANRSKSWLMLETGPAKYVFVPNETVSSQAIANQDVKTVQQQLEEEKAKAEKENDPILYYIKKLGVPLALGAAAVYLIATFGKTFLASKLASKPSLTGPSGSKMWWIGGGALALIGGAIYFIKAKKQADASKAFVDYVQGNQAAPAQSIVASDYVPATKSLPVATPVPSQPIVAVYTQPVRPLPVDTYTDMPVQVSRQGYKRFVNDEALAGDFSSLLR